VSWLWGSGEVAAAAGVGPAIVTDRYTWFEELQELGELAAGEGAFDLGVALQELARLVLNEQEKQAAEMLSAVPSRR
jgi:hypothetical protein